LERGHQTGPSTRTWRIWPAVHPDQNTLLPAALRRNTNDTPTPVDDFARQAGDDPASKAIAREFQEYDRQTEHDPGSPFYEVAQPWMKDYVYQSEWKVLYKKVWLDK
jgi:hypothetical protein